jgi:MinD-like ATPase involved in chromosome partitioning or flagellar assembly
MTLIAVAAGKGSPGVTTAALALASHWPRPTVLAECDPSGGDLAYWLPADDGRPLDLRRGMVSLAAAARHDVAGAQLDEHLQRLPNGVPALVGVNDSDQAATIGPLWSSVVTMLQAATADVLVDLGRLGTAAGPADEVIRHAQLTVLVTRPAIDAVAHLRARLATLRNRYGGGRLGVVVVTDPKDPSGCHDVAAAVDAADLRVPILGRLAWDPKAAAALRGRGRGWVWATALMRSADVLARDLCERLHGREALPFVPSTTAVTS